jgi:hypothetical protein
MNAPQSNTTMFIISKQSGVHAGSCILGGGKTKEEALIDAYGPKPWTEYNKKSMRSACVREVSYEEYEKLMY